MALVECRECGKPVSDTVETCPHCGIANPSVERSAKAVPSQMAGTIAAKMLTEDEKGAQVRWAIFVWVTASLLFIAFITGLLDPVLRYLMT